MSAPVTTADGKTAVIVGAAGQDGRLLQDLLRARGYRLLGLDRGMASGELAWHKEVDITAAGEVAALVKALQPQEIYHLAAFHHSSEGGATQDLDFFRRSYEVNLFSLLNFLEAMRVHAPTARLFYAASSHVFGQGTDVELQNEATPFRPDSVYAMTKVDGLLACRHYRAQHGIFAAVGILYNHESRHRSEAFLSKKVVRAVADIKAGKRQQLVLGSLSAAVDWGYAPDYVEAMAAILAAPQADEFIVATGTRHTVQEFVAEAFAEVGLDWKPYVSESAEVVTRPAQARIGDASKLTRVTGWRPKTSFSQMVRQLVRDEMASVTPR